MADIDISREELADYAISHDATCNAGGKWRITKPRSLAAFLHSKHKMTLNGILAGDRIDSLKRARWRNDEKNS